MRCQTSKIGPSVSTISPSKSKVMALIKPLKVALEELEDATLHVGAVVLGARHVSLVRVDQGLERFAGVDQRLHHARGVAKMHVLIDHAVDQQQLSLQPLSVRQRRAASVALGVLLWRAQVLLGVGGVVALERGAA